MARTLTIGRRYRKADFGIVNYNPAAQIVEGELYLFLTLINTQGLHNLRQKDGVVYEPKHIFELVPQKTTQPALVQVFVRDKAGDAFEYCGLSRSIIRHDKKRNKLLLPVSAVAKPAAPAAKAGGDV
jgi:hypothetical protein